MEESQMFLTLKVFGSIDYMHVDDQVRTKINDKIKKMIFVSYD